MASPWMAPEDRAGIPAESETPEPETLKSEISLPEPARPEAALTATRSTALVLAIPRAERAAAGPGPETAARTARFRRSSLRSQSEG